MSNNIKELIACIRDRPEMYLGPASVTRLGAFLDGYYFSTLERKNSCDDFGSMKDFQDMVEERFSIVQTISWDRILAFVAGDERRGLDLFWKLWDEHTANQKETSDQKEISE